MAATDTTPKAAPAPVLPEVTVTSGEAKAQVQGPAHAPKTTVPVHEVHVRADRVITDTSDPLAVQMGEKVSALTPIAKDHVDGRKPEDVFAEAK